MPRVVLFFPKMGEGQPLQLPMSLLFVASFLIREGIEVKIIDQRLNHDWKTELLEELKKEPLMVGFSVLTGKQILHALGASQFVKEQSQAKVVWGGVHTSLLPEQTLENEYIDFVVIGEGEKTFWELAKNLQDYNDNFEKIKGLGFKKGNQIFINQVAEFINLDELSEIPYHLVDVEKYIAKKSFATGGKARETVFYTSRGCPHQCGFCYNKKFNRRRWRGRSAELVIEDMKELIQNYQIDAFNIQDDEFFVDLERVRKICEMIIKEKWQIEIFTSCRINYVMRMDLNYLKLLFRAGFRTLAFGVESGSSKIQEAIFKDITNEQVLEAIKRLSKVGINSKYYFMCGFPEETVNDLYKTTDLIWKMKGIDRRIRIPAWRVFTPYPGTELYEKSIKIGFKPPRELERWASYDFETVNTPWISRKMARIIKNVAFMVQFIKLDDNGSKSLKYRLSRLWGKWVDFRWLHHWFGFLPEKYIIKLF